MGEGPQLEEEGVRSNFLSTMSSGRFLNCFSHNYYSPLIHDYPTLQVERTGGGEVSEKSGTGSGPPTTRRIPRRVGTGEGEGSSSLFSFFGLRKYSGPRHLERGPASSQAPKEDSRYTKFPISSPASLGEKSISESSLHRPLQEELRLNSVQVGDHATIRLPWAPQEHQNDLDSLTILRRVPHTHQNLDVVVWKKSGRRRSRSLERTSNFRVFPRKENEFLVNKFLTPLPDQVSKKLPSSPSPSPPPRPPSKSEKKVLMAHCQGRGDHHNTMSVEDARASGFINKPPKGWLHPNHLITAEGVSYTVRYIGCLDVNTSMKSLDFETRSLIAKECINQVCEAAGLKSVDKKRKIDKGLGRILGLRPRLENAGSDVHLTITAGALKLTSLDTGATIAVHEMPNISFASGGDATMLDFVAYVAKDSVVGRACFVLECGSGLAQDVITTVGQAFELRFKEYLRKRPPQQEPVQSRAVEDRDDREYYNDLPGKVAPEGEPRRPVALTLPNDKDVTLNLIDFEAPTPPAFGPPHETLDGILGNSVPSTTNSDPFDMHPFGSTLNSTVAGKDNEAKRELEQAPWFHGTVSRHDAEALLKNDGDFLVRESQASAGQYVLTGLEKGTAKHLLLVDPEGVVRTKDQAFDSIVHLICHHKENSLPIISAESMVLLRNPVIHNPR